MIIALTIWLEAGGEPAEGKIGVATVIHNRAAADHMGYAAACLKPRQFSCWDRRHTEKASALYAKLQAANTPEWRDCRAIANAMVRGEFTPVAAWTHYYNPKLAQPAWARNLTHVLTIGNHKFGRLS